MKSTTTVSLRELCHFTKGLYPTLKTEAGPYPLVVTANYRRTADSYQMEGPAVCIPLVSSTGHGDRALHRVHYQEGKFALANLLVALTAREPIRLSMRFLYHLLMARKDDLLVPMMQGTANVSLKIGDIQGVRVTLPPIEEQLRIVARIDSIADRVSHASSLNRKTAVEVDVIVARASIDALSAPSEQHRLRELTTLITDGTHLTPTYVEDGHMFLSAQNVKPFRFMPEVHRKVSYDDYRQCVARAKPARGDIMMARVGAGIGEAAVVDRDLDCAFYVSLALIRPIAERIDSHYLVHWLNSPQGRSMSRAQTLGKGHSQGNLNLKLLREFLIPLPTLAKQKKIVAYLDEIYQKAGATRSLQEQSAAELDALMPSVLDEAFKGELIPATPAT